MYYYTGDFNKDFNLELLEANSCSHIQKLFSAFQTKDFHNLITKPTRATSTSATITDHLRSNNTSLVSDSSIIYTQTSNHFPLMASFKIRLQPLVAYNYKISFRVVTEEKLSQFKKPCVIFHGNWLLAVQTPM